MSSDVVVRRASSSDLETCAAMAAKLVALHHGWDEKRYMMLGDVACGYARFFASELHDAEAVIAIAEKDGIQVGYTYARFEGRDWNALLDEAGKIHDIYVEENARGAGIAKSLLDYAEAELGILGAKRVVLQVATQNQAGQATFAKTGYRTTLIEMCKEL